MITCWSKENKIEADQYKPRAEGKFKRMTNVKAGAMYIVIFAGEGNFWF